MTDNKEVSDPSGTRVIKVDIVSDIMCPWCYIGKKNLETATLDDDVELEIHWRPYQLDPTLPAEGKDRKEYLNQKFGGEERAQEIYSRINSAGKDVGIDFQFEKMNVSPNTMDAHRLIRWAGGIGGETQQNIVRELFELFFEQGAHVGDHEVLVSIADKHGMDANLVRDLLASDQDKDAVQAEILRAQEMGITGVPCFIIDDKFAVMGAQPPAALGQAFQQALNDRET